MTDLLLAIIAALLGGIAFFVKKILDRTDNLDKNFKPIVPAIVEIQGKFADAGHTILFPLTVTPGSPLKLTDYGKQLMRDSGFNDILANKENKKTLVDVVKAMNPQTEYDVQECSRRSIQKLLDNSNPMLRPLKEYAYNSGLPTELLVKPAGILLRDEVLRVIKL